MLGLCAAALVPAAALLWPAPVRADNAIRCGQRLVDVGAVSDQVLAQCGEPTYRDVRSQVEPGSSIPSEVWYYDLGAGQLVRVLSFRDDRLERIDSGGYGGLADSAGSCRPNQPREGWSKYRLLKQCGEPVSKRVESLVTPYPYGHSYRDAGGRVHGLVLPTQVYRETWIYNFGPNYFLRRVTLEDGVVAAVDDEDQRGYHGN